MVAKLREKDEEYAEHLKKVDSFAVQMKELEEKKKAEDAAATNAAAVYAETPLVPSDGQPGEEKTDAPKGEEGGVTNLDWLDKPEQPEAEKKEEA